MSDYISREEAVTIADYAADEHPYDKNPKQPETYSEYNQGWNDACDYIRGRLERKYPADVEPVRHGRWVEKEKYTFGIMYDCSLCENRILDNGHPWNYCPNCGAKMDLEGNR